MTELLFNPFEDRASRNIRNDLSEAFAKSIQAGTAEQLSAVVNGYLERPLAGCFKDYINDRVSKYRTALQIIGDTVKDPISQGIVLWNLQLFFEFHEVLEHAWYHEQDANLKQTMQALIRSAGVYIKREYGFMDSADRIAAKALPVLLKNKSLLAPYFRPEKLLLVLRDRDQLPPHLSQ